MKRIARTIAMILILVMVASSFTSCLSWFLMTGEWPDYSGASGEGAWALIFLPVVDVLLLPVAIIVFAARKGAEAARNKRGEKYDGVDTFSTLIRSLPEEELAALMETFESMPEEELASLMQRFESLSEEELVSYAETVNSFSDREFTAILTAFNNLSEEDIAASMEKFNSMPEESFVAALDTMRHIEFRHQY